jgi:hypothetical protein
MPALQWPRQAAHYCLGGASVDLMQRRCRGASQFRRQPDAAHVSIPVNDFGSDDALPPWIVALKNFQLAGQVPVDGRVILFLVAPVPVMPSRPAGALWLCRERK